MEEQFGDRAFDTELEFINFRIAQEQARKLQNASPDNQKIIMKERFAYKLISLRG